MKSFSSFVLLFLSCGASLSFASTIDATVSGTCGFYQGNVSNVVFSEAFTGNSPACTNFMAGGSFSPDVTLQVGDISATAAHSSSATAPAGYGIFVNFSTTLQVTQEYELNTAALTNPVDTPTGFLEGSFSHTFVIDDGTGAGVCSDTASLTLGSASSSSPNPFKVPVTFGQPFFATETATVSCNEYGPNWGDDGLLMLDASPLVVYDANGVALGSASLITVVPEPATGFLVVGTALALLMIKSGMRRIRA